MQLLSLKAENFKNYHRARLEFGSGVNCFIGLNGAGKTNMLDAIYYLSTGKSYFNPVDKQLIKEGENYFSLKGSFNKQDSEYEVMCVLMEGRKKVIKLNDEKYGKITDHYGTFPAVIVAPSDVNIIMGGSEERRRWLDSVISIEDREYLHHLLDYEKVLQQRNAQLKKMAKEQLQDRSLLEIYNTMLAPLAGKIYNRRKNFIEAFLPGFNNYHKRMAEGHEEVSLQYTSSLQSGDLLPQLEKNFQKDLVLQRTTKGIHRDDLEFLIGENPLKKFGSQGQQKTYLLALKLAQHEYISRKKGFTPLLLLDDVCERLDEERLQMLFGMIKQGSLGQVFLTDSSEERIRKYLGQGNAAKFFFVTNGEVQAEERPLDA